jgi:photoactive yellow protein
MSLEVIDFSANDLDSRLCAMSASQIDLASFGAIKLDPLGNIQQCSKTEGAMTGQSSAEVIGKNFFTDVAPCTNTSRFKGAFDRVVAERISIELDYAYNYQMARTRVKVYMKPALVGGSFWIYIKRP